MNNYEKSCKEFLKGCTCADNDQQEGCKECLKSFCDHIRNLAKNEGFEEINRRIKIGRKDKNGKDICEGDMLETFVHPDIPLRHVVEWSDKYLAWYVRNVVDINRSGDGSCMAFVYFNNSGEVEIVGEI